MWVGECAHARRCLFHISYSDSLRLSLPAASARQHPREEEEEEEKRRFAFADAAKKRKQENKCGDRKTLDILVQSSLNIANLNITISLNITIVLLLTNFLCSKKSQYSNI